MGDRIKRLLAAIIDWNVTCLPGLSISLLLYAQMMRGNSNVLLLILFAIAVLSTLPLFILRDTIFRGRSVGKRIFGLYVVDEGALQPVRGKPAALKNILNLVGPLLYVDALCLLITGKTLGERISKTAVLGKKALQRAQAGESETQQPAGEAPKPASLGRILAMIALAMAVVIIFVTVLLLIIQMTLDKQTTTPQYALAYDYLVESEAYQRLDGAPTVKLQSYSSFTSSDGTTITYGFKVYRYTVEVTLHQENGEWIVCRECTGFD